MDGVATGSFIDHVLALNTNPIIRDIFERLCIVRSVRIVFGHPANLCVLHRGAHNAVANERNQRPILECHGLMNHTPNPSRLRQSRFGSVTYNGDTVVAIVVLTCLLSSQVNLLFLLLRIPWRHESLKFRTKIQEIFVFGTLETHRYA